MSTRRLLAEGTGTLFLLVGVVGSGIMAERLSPDDVGLQLLENAAATAAVLIAIISIFGTISADFNPAITLGAWALGHRAGRDVAPMVIAQLVGAMFWYQPARCCSCSVCRICLAVCSFCSAALICSRWRS